jgi:hypothetical protein
VGEKSLLLVDDCAESAGLSWAGDYPRESLLGSHYGALRDNAAAVIVCVGGVADDVEDIELLGLARLGVRDVDDICAYELYLLDARVAADRFYLLLALESLDGVPTDFEDAVGPVGSLLSTRRLAFF